MCKELPRFLMSYYMHVYIKMLNQFLIYHYKKIMKQKLILETKNN